MVPRITAEKFVGTFARKRNGVVLFNLPAKQQQGGVNIHIPGQITRFNAVVKRVSEQLVVKNNLVVLCVGILYHHLDVLVVARRLKQALFKILLIVAVLNRVGVNLAELVLLLVHRGGLYDDTAVKSAR